MNNDAASSLGLNNAMSAKKRKREIGKVHLLTMGYSKKDGAKLLPMSDAMTEIFNLGVKEMAEAFSNVVHLQSMEQADSLDYANRQTAVTDWRATP